MKKVAFPIIQETDLRTIIKGHGGIWKHEDKVWELPYSKVIELELEDRIVG